LCERLDVPFPHSTAEAAAQLAWTSLRLRARGLAPRPRAAAPNKLRLATAATAVLAFAGHLPIHWLSATHSFLWLALQEGDPRHIIGAIYGSAQIQQYMAPRSRWTRKLIARVESADAELPAADPRRGYAALLCGCLARNKQDFQAARVHFGRAIALFGTAPSSQQTLEVTQYYDQESAANLGQLADIARDTPSQVDRALQRGRVFAVTLLSGTFGMFAWLTPDQPDTAWRRLEEAKKHWPPTRQFRQSDFTLLASELIIARYTGQTARALELAEQCVARMGRSLASGADRLTLVGVQGQCAAAALRDERTAGPERTRLRALLRRSLEQSRRSSYGLVAPRHLRAAALALELDDRAGAVRELRESAQQLPRGAQPGAILGAVWLRLGQLLDDDEGRALIAAGSAALREQGVANLEAMANLLVPGCQAR
jgi:hypothetical protein